VTQPTEGGNPSSKVPPVDVEAEEDLFITILLAIWSRKTAQSPFSVKPSIFESRGPGLSSVRRLNPSKIQGFANKRDGQYGIKIAHPTPVSPFQIPLKAMRRQNWAEISHGSPFVLTVIC
jgi:hypothetical protein